MKLEKIFKPKDRVEYETETKQPKIKGKRTTKLDAFKEEVRERKHQHE